MIKSLLEPHLKRRAGATQVDVGMTFLIAGGVYMISSAIGGLVSGHVLLIFVDYVHIYTTFRKLAYYVS